MTRPFWASALLVPVLAFAADTPSSSPASAAATAAPLAEIDGIGKLHRKVTTSSAEAQRLFDEGLMMMYAFNHQEAILRFEKAAEADPACAMAYWGKALCLGPNINYPMMDEETTKLAVETVALAREHAPKATALEQALVDAVAARYALPYAEDRSGLDSAYAAKMTAIWEAHPEDADVGAIRAEALLDLSPWNQWTKDGKPQPGTGEVVRTLESVLALAPEHPLGLHLYIHTIEASSDPGRALPAADRLRNLVPGAGHLVHMPGHIDIRLGRYADAIEANRKGIAADLKYVEQVGRHGFYTMYRAHNYHFLVYAAMFDGQSAVALEHARGVQRELPMEVVRQLGDFLDAFVATPYHVMVRFGKWQEILDEPMPPADLKVSSALAHYARCVAASSLGKVDVATKELEAFEKNYAEVPESAVVGNNAAATVLDIARLMAKGELEYRKGNHDEAFGLLRDAVAKDVALKYDEPWGWFQPVRHALGALLLEQGRVEEAETVYRDDLKLHPSNGWSLTGLAECLRRTGRTEDAAKVEAELAKSWARADVKTKVSCFCRRA